MKEGEQDLRELDTATENAEQDKAPEDGSDGSSGLGAHEDQAEASPSDLALGETPAGLTDGAGEVVSRASEWKTVFVEYAQALVIAAVLAGFIITFVVQSFLVQGHSMEPTLHNAERLFVNKFIYRFTEPQRGDVVVFRYPADESRKFIKRVIGLPGDVVAIEDGTVYVNGKALDEPYIAEKPYRGFPASVVPEGTYFVLGDNRNNSEDSRYPDVGFVPRKNIVGKAFVVWWPFTNMRILQHPRY